jgi:hypothetical protein
MPRRNSLLGVAVPALLLAGSIAHAEVVNVVTEGFETSPLPYNYAYGYAGGGNPPTDRGGLTSAHAIYDFVGREGSRALSLNGDFSQIATVPPLPDYNYSGFGGGFGSFLYNFETNKPLGLPSPNLSDYTGHIDLAAAGIRTATVPGEIQVQLQLPDDFFTPDDNTDFTPFANINIPVRVGTDFQTYTFSLDQVTPQFDAGVPEAERDFAKHFRDIGLINWNFNVASSDANSGNDADNFFYVDNVVLDAANVVPEPASAALLLGGAGVLLMRRRGA